MSSEDETPSLGGEQPPPVVKAKKTRCWRKRCAKADDSHANFQTLGNIFEISTGRRLTIPKSSANVDRNVEVESGVEALEDSLSQDEKVTIFFLRLLDCSQLQVFFQDPVALLPKNSLETSSTTAEPDSDQPIANEQEVAASLAEHIENVTADPETGFNVRHVAGTDIQQSALQFPRPPTPRTYLGPAGFVDLRTVRSPVSFAGYLLLYVK